MSEKQVQKPLRTRYYYTDYVNHAIRFYLSTPDTLQVAGKRKADTENWMAVQSVYHFLTDEQKKILSQVYRLHFRLPEGVRMYCERTGANEREVWILVTNFNTAVAKRRGLI